MSWFVYLEYPIFGRGVRLAHGNGGGLFAVATRYGDGYVACSFREWFVNYLSSWVTRGSGMYFGNGSRTFSFLNSRGESEFAGSFRI